MYGQPSPYDRAALTVPTNALASQSLQQRNSSSSNIPRLTINNFASFHARPKKLPPDANVSAAPHTRLWQFDDRVCFACVKCRRDNIQSDSVAVDVRNRVILCTACFTRIVRPRTYRPTRVVPFPSLLSWLRYTPSRAADVATDVLERPAEAVAPSGSRVALPSIAGGDRAADIGSLPAIAMHVVSQSSAAAAGATAHDAQQQQQPSRHPCVRVWGACLHGETCLFRNAPYDLCLAFLMGLCRRQHRGGGSSKTTSDAAALPSTSCTLLHQYIYDLPTVADPAPTLRYPGDVDDEASAWGQWLQRRRGSLNSAEWQLWHNGSPHVLLDHYAPVTQPPPPSSSSLPSTAVAASTAATPADDDANAPSTMAAADDNTAADDTAEVHLNIADIMSALAQVKRSSGNDSAS